MGVNLTYEETLRLLPERASEHPDAPGRKKVRKVQRLNEQGMNKTEALFWARLKSLRDIHAIRDFWFEPLKLRLAGNTSYRIDFLVWRNDGSLAGIEIKGFFREDAAVKIKTSVDKFPWLDFFVAFWRKSNWDIRRVSYTGIGRESVGDGWTRREEL